MSTQKQPWPSIAEVAAELRALNANVEGECEVRLQVREGEPLAWNILFGDPSYDTDHGGYWSAASIPGVVGGVIKRFNSREVARDLIEQCRDMHAQGEG